MESLLKGNVIPYGVACSQIPQDSLIASYLLQGTAESETGSFNGTESSATYVYNDKRGIVYNGGGSITIPATGGSDCTYWVDTGTGWTFTHTTTIPSTLTTNKYSNLHIYNRVLSSAEATFIQDLEQYQHNNPLDHGLIAYYPLDGNSLDNAINQYDGTDTSVSYVADSTFGIVLDCGAGNVGLPTATGHAMTYYWENTGSGWVHNSTSTEITSFTTNKYAHVRKYNRTLSALELAMVQDFEKGLICNETITINNPDPFEDGSGIALYKLDGNANDTTGVYNGTPTNVTYTNGEFGQSAVFNGSTSYITVPTGIITATDVFTVAIWFKTTLSGTAEYMVYNALDAEYVLWIDANNKLAGGVYASGWSLPVSVNTYNDGNWHLAILQYDRTTTTLNVDNGAEVITDTVATGDMRALARHSLIGAGTSGSIIGHWNGNLDQARFFDRVLTADEITKLYNERKV